MIPEEQQIETIAKKAADRAIRLWHERQRRRARSAHNTGGDAALEDKT